MKNYYYFVIYHNIFLKRICISFSRKHEIKAIILLKVFYFQTIIRRIFPEFNRFRLSCLDKINFNDVSLISVFFTLIWKFYHFVKKKKINESARWILLFFLNSWNLFGLYILVPLCISVRKQKLLNFCRF